MADATQRPMVVATIEPNKWSMMHADICVANTGTAPAFNIAISYDPPLALSDELYKAQTPPLSKISALRPGQMLRCYFADNSNLPEGDFSIIIEWQLAPHTKKRRIGWKRFTAPGNEKRERLTYMMNMGHFEGFSKLGSDDPLMDVAGDLKKLREDFARVTGGQRRLQVDAFSSEDRAAERERLQRQREEMRAKNRDE